MGRKNCRRASTLPPKLVDQRGPFWMPIRGPILMPIDTLSTLSASVSVLRRLFCSCRPKKEEPHRAQIVSALAATAGETSFLVKQIAAGSKPAMLLRFVRNESLAERGFLDVWRQAGRFQWPLVRLDVPGPSAVIIVHLIDARPWRRFSSKFNRSSSLRLLAVTTGPS